VDFKVSLHEQQLEVFKDPSRFKVVSAGRRWGKTRLAIYNMLVNGLQIQSEANVYYIAPTFEQAKRLVWDPLRRIAGYSDHGGLIEWHHENTATARLINGRKIFVCGSDNPDALRGDAMGYAVLDEYASMKPFIWKEIVRPALMDARGGALFIGTPKGKNHFYELFKRAQVAPGWRAWQFKSRDNPFLVAEELDAIKEDYHESSAIERRELEASFEAYEGGLFKEEWIRYAEEPAEGDWYMTTDLAGFERSLTERNKSGSKLDETAIVSVKVHEGGWWVGGIEHGRWDVRETATRILMEVRRRHPKCLGIENGALKNAVMPYLEEQMRTYGIFPRIEAVTHGKMNKAERIQWALQGRFEKGRVALAKADWNTQFIEQFLDFPNPQAHDDLVDALAYIDQVAVPMFAEEFETPEYEPLDMVIGS
jgi:predicted phage terminase large subunit-like protein